MTIDREMIKGLAAIHFSGSMPKELEAYLYDRYGEEPLEGDLPAQFFWPSVHSDICAYLNGKLDTRIRTPLEKLQDRYDELSSIVSNFAESNRLMEQELRYLHDYISWKDLEEELHYFIQNAHEAPCEDGPFSHYVL